MSYIGNSPGVASQRVTTTLTATAGQTQFTTQSGYVLGYVDAYLNGAKLVNGSDFEAITGTYITLFAGASAGDVVELISYVPRGLSDGYTKAEADAKFLDVGGDTASGNLAFATASLTGNLTLSGGTANGIGYLNGSKVLTTGSALTFDGTNFATTGIITAGSSVLSTASGNTARMIAGAGGIYFGSTTAADVIFQYNQNEGMRLTSTALYTTSSVSIGIGTNNPAAKLDVNGGAIFRGNTTVASGNILYLSNSVNTASGTIFCPGGGSLSLASYGNEMIRLNEDASIIFKVGSATERARIDNTGALIIGPAATINTNSSKLVVNGTISQTVGGTQYLVVDQSDVGTAPNQIPLNQYLGSMAFQDRENINFTGGTGALSSLDIAAVSQQLNVSAVDVFVYDTSKDSDGGAWRKRTQHTSWYNEPLNTPVRGSRREFPAVAVIVVTTNYVTIHDGDDPTLPMWMGFKDASYAGQLWENTAVCVAALNGKIAVGCNPYDLQVVDFIADKAVSYSNNSSISGTHKFPISGRAPATGTYSSPADIWTFGTVPNILSRFINDVAITVLPNAPVDPVTGLPVPTIAVATDIGLSVIKDNGTVVNLVNGNSSYLLTTRVMFNKKNQLQFVMDASGRYLRTFNIPSGNVTVSQWDSSADDGITVGLETPSDGSFIYGIAENALGTGTRLNLFSENIVDASKSLFNYTTSKFNTGWLVGDTKAAWLTDTTQETISAVNLVSNSTCDTTTGYSVYNSTATMSAGGGVITFTSTITGLFGGGIMVYNLIPGRQYTFKATVSTAYGSPSVRVQISGVGLRNASGALSTAGTKVVKDSFTATGTSHFLEILDYSTHPVGTTFTVDNVYFQLADSDRSNYANALEVYGILIKTAVAAGSDVVGYSGFTAVNYLYQPNNSNLDFGTSDFSVSSWINPNNQGSFGGVHLVFNGAATGLTGTAFGILGGSSGRIDLVIGGVQHSNENILNPGDVWQHLVVTRRSGIFYCYVNGILKFTNSNVVNLTGVATELYIGGYFYSGNFTAVNNKFALLRMSATAPTPDQITKMYNDEKVLFQDNAKATLYGTSNSVTALAYDEYTQLLHVGTSSGRSVFDGLRRVDNTTTAVTAAISAVDGLVAEN